MSNQALNSLYENNFFFRLYADHQFGMSINDLSRKANMPAEWVAERIEAMRLAIEKQVCFEPSSSQIAF